jgi:phosphomevalonate kinase
MTIASSRVTVRAPGKLFLLGEYAVLYGGPAIVQAVNRYVVVTVESSAPVQGPRAPRESSIEVTALGATFTPLKATWGDSLHFRSPQRDHALVMAILDGLAAQNIIDENLGSVRCTIDSRELFHQEHKLGLGSSAAVTHALVRALAEYANRESQNGEDHGRVQRGLQLPPDLVFSIHRAFQRGRGSGADIGAGVMGGIFEFRRASEHTLPIMREVSLPANVYMSPVWAGRPASTVEALGSLAEFQSRHPGRFTAALTPLLETAEDGLAALGAGDGERFVRICDDYGHNLSEFGRTVGVDIMSSAHRELRKIAKASGIVYKPSGAGNGDFGVGYANDIKALRYFERRAKHAGFTPLALASGKPCHRI